jgi:hypothetical protein
MRLQPLPRGRPISEPVHETCAVPRQGQPIPTRFGEDSNLLAIRIVCNILDLHLIEVVFESALGKLIRTLQNCFKLCLVALDGFPLPSIPPLSTQFLFTHLDS